MGTVFAKKLQIRDLLEKVILCDWVALRKLPATPFPIDIFAIRKLI